jgi:hypothetical protein
MQDAAPLTAFMPLKHRCNHEAIPIVVDILVSNLSTYLPLSQVTKNG